MNGGIVCIFSYGVGSSLLVSAEWVSSKTSERGTSNNEGSALFRMPMCVHYIIYIGRPNLFHVKHSGWNRREKIVFYFTMAYSKELETVIEAALADGVLTDKERAVLHKKAQQEGIDPDELDVVIEGRLAKMKRQEDWLKPVPPIDLAVTKKGNVMKCPACGKPYEPGTGACPHCGHVFQNLEGNHSAQIIAREIAKIREKYIGKKNDSDIDELHAQIKSLIANYPIPSTKDDFIEFLSAMNAGRHTHDALCAAYNQKYQECLTKAQILFNKDNEIDKAVALTNKWTLFDAFLCAWSSLSSGTKEIIGFLLSMLGLFIVLCIIQYL